MRRRRRRDRGPENPRQKALDLIEIALDRSTTEDERRSAAMRAVEHIDRYDLLSVPFSGNETVQAAMNVVETLTDSNLVNSLKTIGSELANQARRRR